MMPGDSAKAGMDALKSLLESWVLSAAVLFASIALVVLDFLKYPRITEIHGAWFIGALILIPLTGLNLIRMFFSPLIERRARASQKIKYLRSLNPSHMHYIQRLYQTPEGLELHSQNAIISELAANKVIFQTSSVGTVDQGRIYLRYGIQPWARDEIDKNPSQFSFHNNTSKKPRDDAEF